VTDGLRLSVPGDGIRGGNVLLRMPVLDDVDGFLPAFGDPDMREAGNLPAFGREELLASLGDIPAMAESGRLLPLPAVDPEMGEMIGAGMLHHLDREWQIGEIGYFVGNVASERVLERAGFTREGVVRSLPVPDGRHADKTLFSLLPGD